MTLDKKHEGQIGENLAVLYLQKQGYLIIERNFRTRNGELDIVAIDRSEKPGVLSFIEVKARKSTRYGTPLDAIGFYKLQALIRTAEFYKATHKDLPENMRIDAVTVVLNNDNTVKEIGLVKNITG